MATTLLLDRTAWDLAADASGNIALASEPYSQAQDVASACRVEQGEEWYDTTIGVPFRSRILGHVQPMQILREKLISESQSVPGVTIVTPVLSAIVGRRLSGQIQFMTDDGTQAVTL